MNTESFEIENETWMFIWRGWRVKAKIEFWIPKTHPLWAGITESSHGRFTRSPKDGPEELDSWIALKGFDRPREVISYVVIDPYERCWVAAPFSGEFGIEIV
jgi:hypothetical protein